MENVRTPSEEKKILDIEAQKVEIDKKKIQVEKQKNEWETCCSRSDSHFIRFVAQLVFSGTVMVFSIVQVAKGTENPSIYFSLISGILGVYLPTPTLDKKPI